MVTLHHNVALHHVSCHHLEEVVAEDHVREAIHHSEDRIDAFQANLLLLVRAHLESCQVVQMLMCLLHPELCIDPIAAVSDVKHLVPCHRQALLLLLRARVVVLRSDHGRDREHSDHRRVIRDGLPIQLGQVPLLDELVRVILPDEHLLWRERPSASCWGSRDALLVKDGEFAEEPWLEPIVGCH